MDQVDIQGAFKRLQVSYHKITTFLFQQIVDQYPRLVNFSHFDLFILLNLFIIFIFMTLNLLAQISFKGIYRKIIKLVFSLPFVKKQVDSNLKKIEKQISNLFQDELKPIIVEIPHKPSDVKIGDSSDKKSLEGQLSGSRYPCKNHSDFVASLSKNFSFVNPLHIQRFPLLKQMQNEVIQMVANMLDFKDQKGDACGTFNSGGTQSIIMAILACREYKMKHHGVIRPNLVICKTGHVAAQKACDYLNVQVREVQCDKNYEMDIRDMKSKIDSQTICVYTSYPNYPYGTVDPIGTIAAICKKKQIPVHVDMCLGGFVVPFLKDETNKNPMFRVPQGVTTISVDPHKYGLSAKGASILLFNSDKLRKQQYFVTCYWPGGLYGTPGLAGSRSGIQIASAWISMMKMGVKGYTQNAIQLQNTILRLTKQLINLDFVVYGKPNICVMAFKHKKYSVNSIQHLMKNRGWGLSLNQNPLCLHYSFTPLNCSRIDKMIQDFKDSVAQASKNDNLKEGSQMQLYGACSKIPDGMTKITIINKLVDSFLDIV